MIYQRIHSTEDYFDHTATPPAPPLPNLRYRHASEQGA